MKKPLRRALCRTGLVCLVALSSIPAAFAHAEVFSDFNYEKAKAVALKDKKLLLLDFTATWCGPCRMMEKNTWADSSVKEWLEKNAIAIQVDVDKDRAVSKQFKIRAMPTVVLFTPKSGENEFDRKVGYMGPTEVLSWLQGAKAGKSKQELRKSSAGSGSGSNEYIQRLSKVQQLGVEKKYGEALEELLWLWKNLDGKPGQLSLIRMSLVPSYMKRVIREYPKGQSRVEALRDAAKKSEKWTDWLTLNVVLRENEKSLEWFDSIKKDDSKKALIEENARVLIPVLFTEQRWTDMTDYYYPDPIATIRKYHKKAEAAKKGSADTQVSKNFDPFPNMVMMLYAAYVGAGKTEEVEKIKAECLSLNDTPRMRKVLKAMGESMETAREPKEKKSK